MRMLNGVLAGGLIAGLFPAYVGADALTLTGRIHTKLPTISISTSADPVAHVKPFTLTVSENAGVCRVTHDIAAARKHTSSRPYCLITWHDQDGLTQYLRGLSGIADGAGEKTFTYTLTVYDATTFQPLMEDIFSVHFSYPEQPEFVGIETRWTHREDSDELQYNVYNRQERNTYATIEAEPRNFVQKVTFGDLSCTIPQGSTTCTVNINKSFTALPVEGSEDVALNISDNYGYFNPDNHAVIYDWSFHPPEVVSVHVNANDSLLPQIIEGYGDNIILLPDQAAIIVRSPHGEIVDPRFMPADPSLSIVPSADLLVTDTLSYENVTVRFNLGPTPPMQAHSAYPLDAPIIYGPYIVYIYDFSDITDGLYNFNFSTLDGHGNGEQVTEANVYIDRIAPDIQISIAGRQARQSTTSRITTLSDITVYAWGGWEDGTEIASVLINEQPVSFTGGTERIKRLEDMDLEQGTLNTLRVTALDATGNTRTREFELRTTEFAFTERTDTPMAFVQPAELTVTQRSGARCVFTTNHEVAVVVSNELYPHRRGCTVQWHETPPGMEPIINDRHQPILRGKVPAEGEHPYSYTVYLHDAFGASRAIYNGSGLVNVEELTAPDISVGIARLSEGIPGYRYNAYIDREILVPYEVIGERGSDVVVELRSPQGDVLQQTTQNLRRQNYRGRFAEPHNHDLHQEGELVVRAYYDGHPGLYTEQTYPYYVLPSTTAYLETSVPGDLFEASSSHINANVKFRNSDYASSIGTWDVFIGIRNDEGDLVPMGAVVQTDAQGFAQIPFSVDDYAMVNGRIMVVADLQTNHPNASYRITSRAVASLSVLTLTDLSVELHSTQLSAPTPAVFRLRINPERLVDRNTIGNVQWERTSDPATDSWSPMPASGLTHMIYQESEGRFFVRARTTHAVTGQNFYTNVLELNAYDAASIAIHGDRRIYQGSVATLTAELNDIAQDKLSGDVLWSVDNGQNWDVMPPNAQVSLEETTDILVRAQLSGYVSEAIEARHRVFVSPLSSLRPKLSLSESHAEVGQMIEVVATEPSGRMDIPDAYQMRIITPDGIEHDDTTITHTLTSSDFYAGRATFRLVSWVEGRQHQTINVIERPVRRVDYEFPTAEMVLPQTIRTVYSDVLVQLRYRRNRSTVPSSVNFDYDISTHASGTVRRKSPTQARLSFETPGVYPINIRFYDNRGNEQDLLSFVEIVEAEPMTLTVRESFSNPHKRNPLRVSYRYSARPGSFGDRVASAIWLINGEEAQEGQGFRHIFEEPDTYQVSLVVESLYGQTAEKTMELVVHENMPPFCEPYWEVRGSHGTLHANCMDTDGVITSVHFFYLADDGETMIERRRYQFHRITFNLDNPPSTSPITIIGVDDSGDTFETTINWPSAGE